MQLATVATLLSGDSGWTWSWIAPARTVSFSRIASTVSSSGVAAGADRPTDGWVYCCAVTDAWSRRVVGWAIADHVRSKLVVDALAMARRQRSRAGTIVHADGGAKYTSRVFGHRLRAADLLDSMGRAASSVDNALIESFWSTTQRELLDRQHWDSGVELASAIFEWVESWYNPRRRHKTLGMMSPHEYETLHTAAIPAA